MPDMKFTDVIRTLENIAPLHFAEEWDNVGLLINPLKPRQVKKIMLTIDLTEAVADEAIAAKTDLIVTYHPILFRPANRLNADSAYDRAVLKLVQKNIAVYSPHTALDAVIGGVNILEDDPEPALDLYFRQCSLQVTCRDLSVMAATLATGGINPLTRERALDPRGRTVVQRTCGHA